MALTKVSTNMIEPLTSADVGLGNVNNTSDANKPISTATSAALANKVDNAAASICKAWVNFNGKSVAISGAITPAASYGVGTVYKVAAGKYQVALWPARPNANYVVTSTMGAKDDVYNGDWVIVVANTGAGGFEVHVWDKTNGVYKDLDLLMFAVFGN